MTCTPGLKKVFYLFIYLLLFFFLGGNDQKRYISLTKMVTWENSSKMYFFDKKSLIYFWPTIVLWHSISYSFQTFGSTKVRLYDACCASSLCAIILGVSSPYPHAPRPYADRDPWTMDCFHLGLPWCSIMMSHYITKGHYNHVISFQSAHIL